MFIFKRLLAVLSIKQIRESYTIHNKFVFDSPENEGLMNHLYNIKANQYDEIFIFIERMSTSQWSRHITKRIKKNADSIYYNRHHDGAS